MASSQVSVDPSYIRQQPGTRSFAQDLIAFRDNNQARKSDAQQEYMKALAPIAQKNTVNQAMKGAREDREVFNTDQIDLKYRQLNSTYETEVAKLKQGYGPEAYEMRDAATGRMKRTSLGEALDKKFNAEIGKLNTDVSSYFNKHQDAMYTDINDSKAYGEAVAKKAMEGGLSYEEAQKIGAAETAKYAKPGMSKAEELMITERGKNQREIFKQRVEAELDIGKIDTSTGGSGSSSSSSNSSSTSGGLYKKGLELTGRKDPNSLFDGPYDYATGDSQTNVSDKIGQIRRMFPNDKQAYRVMEQSLSGTGEGKYIDMEKVNAEFDRLDKSGKLITDGYSGKSKKTSFKGQKDPVTTQKNIKKLTDDMNRNTNASLDKYREKGISEKIFGSKERDVFGNMNDDYKAIQDAKKAKKKPKLDTSKEKIVVKDSSKEYKNGLELSKTLGRTTAKKFDENKDISEKIEKEIKTVEKMSKKTFTSGKYDDDEKAIAIMDILELDPKRETPDKILEAYSKLTLGQKSNPALVAAMKDISKNSKTFVNRTSRAIDNATVVGTGMVKGASGLIAEGAKLFEEEESGSIMGPKKRDRKKTFFENLYDSADSKQKKVIKKITDEQGFSKEALENIALGSEFLSIPGFGGVRGARDIFSVGKATTKGVAKKTVKSANNMKKAIIKKVKEKNRKNLFDKIGKRRERETFGPKQKSKHVEDIVDSSAGQLNKIRGEAIKKARSLRTNSKLAKEIRQALKDNDYKKLSQLMK